MNKFWRIFLFGMGSILFFLIFFFVWRAPIQLENTSPISLTEEQVYDCTKDFDCFIRTAVQCTPATVTHTVLIHADEQEKETALFFEIEESDIQDHCDLYVLIQESRYPDSAGRQGEQFEEFIGRDGVCTIPRGDISSFLTQWREKNFAIQDALATECRGTYFTPL